MGNDGGVIAVKRKFMRHARGQENQKVVDSDLNRLDRIHNCSLSGEPLRDPVVACKLGNLYNKQALLETLLAKSMPERLSHIKSLRDIVKCNIKEKKDSRDNSKQSSYYCPISMIEFNGCNPFIVLGSCGCMVSMKAWKELKSEECLVCGTLVNEAKIIPLLLSPEDYAMQQSKLLSTQHAKKIMQGHEARTSRKRSTTRQSLGENVKHKKIVHEIAARVDEEKRKSAVYTSLFQKQNLGKSANDLMMTVGGMRYTLS